MSSFTSRVGGIMAAVLAVTAFSGCASGSDENILSAELTGVSAESANHPSVKANASSPAGDLEDWERWMACGATTYLERTNDAVRPTPAEAIQLDLDFYAEAQRSGKRANPQIPNELYVALLDGALLRVSDTENQKRSGRVDVVVAGESLGMVEITPRNDGYFVSMYSFAPLDEKRCEENLANPNAGVEGIDVFMDD